MKTRYFNIYLLLLVLFVAACRQPDAQVTPIGKSITYAGPSKTIRQLLDSTGLTIYKAIWNKTNMDSVMANKSVQAYTLLAPSDAAFTAAGITIDKVNAMPVAALDTILFYNTLSNWISSDRIKSLMGNMAIRTFLTQADFADFTSWSPYTYYQYLGLHNGKLMVNGKPHPFQPLDATNGTIYVLDQLLSKPDQDMMDYLGNNPDFTFFIEACRLSDSIYQSMWGQQGFTKMLTTNQGAGLFTLFAPTNHAFQVAGFKTFDDLAARALLYPVDYPHYDANNYYVTPLTSLDSVLLVNHLDYNGNTRPEYPMVLFSNDWSDNPSLSNFLIKGGSMYQNPPQYIRLSCSVAGDKVLLKQLGSTAAPLSLLTTDLLFRNGVIHVINDGLFMP